jgi:uncharacterized protein YaiE (UPF0345 family)
MFKINQYFDGQVASIAFQTNNQPATIGVMAIGEYEFSTSKKETMTVVNGEFIVKLAGDDNWNTYNTGDSFMVAANDSFQLKVNVETAYLCTYE